MSNVALILQPSRIHYADEWWPEDDYVVLFDGRVVGRIYAPKDGPQAGSWYWSLFEVPEKGWLAETGREASLEAATGALDARWRELCGP